MTHSLQELELKAASLALEVEELKVHAVSESIPQLSVDTIMLFYTE